MSRFCKKCGVEIPPQRLKVLPNTVSCVKCSDVSLRKGIPIQLGEGDHTCTELVIVDEEEYNRYHKLKEELVQIITPSQEEEDEVIPDVDINSVDTDSIPPIIEEE
jgi:hypothetical protein